MAHAVRRTSADMQKQMVKDAFHTSSAKAALLVISESVQGKPSAGRRTYEHKQVKDEHRKVRTAVP